MKQTNHVYVVRTVDNEFMGLFRTYSAALRQARTSSGSDKSAKKYREDYWVYDGGGWMIVIERFSLPVVVNIHGKVVDAHTGGLWESRQVLPPGDYEVSYVTDDSVGLVVDGGVVEYPSHQVEFLVRGGRS